MPTNTATTQLPEGVAEALKAWFLELARCPDKKADMFVGAIVEWDADDRYLAALDVAAEQCRSRNVNRAQRHALFMAAFTPQERDAYYAGLRAYFMSECFATVDAALFFSELCKILVEGHHKTIEAVIEACSTAAYCMEFSSIPHQRAVNLVFEQLKVKKVCKAATDLATRASNHQLNA